MADILIVDDEETIRRTLKRLLEKSGHFCVMAADAAEARDRVAERSFDLVLCDVNMPGESGIDLVRFILSQFPETAAVMVTALDDPEFARMALEIGAYGYIIKPFEFNEVLIDVANALRRRNLEIDNREHREQLEKKVRQRTEELQRAITRLERAEQEIRVSREETIHRLSKAAEFRDDETARHIQRMSRYCALLARLLGYPPERVEEIRIASPMHDVGKIGIPDRILLKPGRLTDEEFDTMKRHTDIGYRILAGSNAEPLDLASIIAWTHHERFDGRGYPRGLAGDEIPIEGRIAAIADVFDALTTDRVYRAAMPVEEAVDLMREGRGMQFDAAFLDLFLDALDEISRIKEKYADG